ncbi:MAG: DJ-1/PfpI family protein [Steroidobacteraceae bacterium]|jgi:cyclohexyl-isocyanide hydratase|nr:DJ-1/PfpI family protein [Steroidobacteraceae bacterium]
MSTTDSPPPPAPFHVAILLFPGVTQLDFTGPLEVLHRVPGLRADLVWRDLEPVQCAAQTPPALRVLPSCSFESLARTDLLLVPGGPGVAALLADDEVLGFLRRMASTARYVTSVCTGALVLGAAGLLEGYRATTHWAYRQWLPRLGAIPVPERVVVDRDRITGGGVTSGIDFALRVIAEIRGERLARLAQLGLEYDPRPPYDSGTPEAAAPELVASMRELMRGLTARAGAAVEAAAARRDGCGDAGTR